MVRAIWQMKTQFNHLTMRIDLINLKDMKTIIGVILFFFSGIMVYSQKLPAWEEGMMEIHHINTGRGDASFLIFPDGTTLLIDAGDMSETNPRTLSDRNTPIIPDNSHSAPEWIVKYIRTFHPLQAQASIDYVLVTHYHSDHYGQVDNLRKDSGNGYKLTGITEVGHHLKIRHLIDRGFDDSISEAFIRRSPTLDNFLKFIDYQSENSGMQHWNFKVGSSQQFTLLRNPGKYPDFEVRNIYCAGKIWEGYSSENYFFALPEGQYHGENNSSTGIRITYGLFNYFNGGDISGVDNEGYFSPNSMEAQAAPVIGPVDIAALNHHGNRDSQCPSYVRAIRPRVWVVQNWTSDQPGDGVLRRITSQKLYPGARDVYATSILDATKNVIGSLVDKTIIPETGHIVIRVYQGGNDYSVFVLDDYGGEYEILQQNEYGSR
jgi:beta-lactamase superfamily II metal-dependent hydrolase